MNPNQLRRLLDVAGLSQTGAARALDMSDRTMRRYISGELPIPRVVEAALRQHIAKAGKSVVGIDELTERELKSFRDAVDRAKAATWSRRHWIHCEPLKDGTGRLCEVRVRGGESLPVLAVIPIGDDGRPQTAQVRL